MFRLLTKKFFCPGQDVKKYLNCVQFDNRKVFRAQDPQTKLFKRFFFV